MKTRQSKRLHNQNVGTTKPVHLHNNEEQRCQNICIMQGM